MSTALEIMVGIHEYESITEHAKSKVKESRITATLSFSFRSASQKLTFIMLKMTRLDRKCTPQFHFKDINKAIMLMPMPDNKK